MSVRTITLTDAAPVRIDEDNWPIIAQASGPGVDELQTIQNNLIVRQHEDGRVIVSAVRQNGEQYSRAGCIPTDAYGAEDLPPHIHRVASDAGMPVDIARRCIADLPPVDLG